MNQDLYLHGLIGGGSAGWTRPVDWLQIPSLSVFDDKVYLLVKIIEDTTANYLGLTCTVAGDSLYSVDWGDGNTTTSHSGKVEHQYNLADISADTLTSEGWRQVLVTITPVDTILTSVDLTTTHQNAGQSVQPIIQANLNCPSMTSFTCSGMEGLVIVELGVNSITNFNSMFNVCTGLISTPTMYTSAGTSFNSMFAGCYSLTTLTNMDTSSGTSFSSMFTNCYALPTIPLIDTSSGTDLNYMFYFCQSLTELPLIDTSAATSLISMLGQCYALKTIPLLNTSSCTDFSYMFINCYSLLTIPLLNTSSGTNFGGMFNNCYSLSSIPALDTSSGTDFGGMFYGCNNLETVPALDVSSALSLNSMFYYVYSLRVVDITGISIGFDLSYMCLDRANIVNVFNNLSIIPPNAYNLVLYNNPGLVDLTEGDIAIATDKGWFVQIADDF